MAESKTKSRTFRRIKKRIVSGTIERYVKKKPKKAHCGGCGALLRGVPSDLAYKIRKLPKTRRRPQRTFGGVLCAKCAREELKKKARK